MAHQNRSIVPGGTYHVMNRGNRKQAIYVDERDRREFLRILIQEQAIHRIQTLALCLMRTHFHLALHTPLGNLSDFMEQLEGQFARYSNWRHKNVGHVFQGPYTDVQIDGNIHLLTALCYIFMNPVASSVAEELHRYRWSTYAATAGHRPLPSYLTVDWLESLFPESPLEDAQRRFRTLMLEGKPVHAYIAQDQLNVSPEVVKRVIRSYTGEKLQAATQPQLYRTALRPSFEELLTEHSGNRLYVIRDARVLYGYSCGEIAEALDLHPASISRLFRKHVTSGLAAPEEFRLDS